jgi:phosphatidylglycerophosphatase A
MTQSAEAAAPKPRLAFAIATSFGLGYLPKAPGTWGSLFGVVLGWGALTSSRWWFYAPIAGAAPADTHSWAGDFAWMECALVLIVSAAGLWAAGQVSAYLGKSDPQIVVVDEVAGQLIVYLGLATPRTFAANWKYLLAGLILFRVFDIWKPFPARQAESLPGGLGIMADDWIAGVFAALVLGFARYWGV